jgi:hypothetical protein
MWLTSKRARLNFISTVAATTVLAIAGLGTAAAEDVTATIEGNSEVYGSYEVTVTPAEGNIFAGNTSGYGADINIFLVDPGTHNVVAEVTSPTGTDQYYLDTSSSVDSNIGHACPNASECILGSLGSFVDLTPIVNEENGGSGICCGTQGLAGGANYLALREDTAAAAPEPATLPLTLFALGSAAIPVWRRRRTRSAK